MTYFFLGVWLTFILLVFGQAHNSGGYKMVCKMFDGNDICTVTHRQDKKFKTEFVRPRNE